MYMGVNNIRQMDIYTSEPLVPESSVFQVELAAENVKRKKSSGVDQILVALIKAGSRKICTEIHNFINSVWN